MYSQITMHVPDDASTTEEALNVLKSAAYGCATNVPIEAVVAVVRQRERRDNQTTRHGAHLLTQPICILTDPLVSASYTTRKDTTNHMIPPCDGVTYMIYFATSSFT